VAGDPGLMIEFPDESIIGAMSTKDFMRWQPLGETIIAPSS
jgi:hypothetical protein